MPTITVRKPEFVEYALNRPDIMEKLIKVEHKSDLILNNRVSLYISPASLCWALGRVPMNMIIEGSKPGEKIPDYRKRGRNMRVSQADGIELEDNSEVFRIHVLKANRCD
jgi:hypothetical protein